ncbi:transcriptional regulator [Sporosarcina sp. P37]|uniref:helix-turn-helix transcriptional regulator n=1 Tax=unclassified Sporosarcina TaxID=2647733 RepID=UPI000A17DCB5|nr:MULTISPECIES: helix-turn-helix transcriptional regulator [unclassified Sporosarcina]ARK25118.1 transcriptional regulator [Sporosarcina sp. P37]PID17892.1 transcriptional regulator [Sporosarcina sp. P35]
MNPNQLIFDSYMRMADAIYSVFNVNCEVVIHDVTKVESSLIYLKGDVTGRSVGAPTTEVILKELKKKNEDIKDLNGIITNTTRGKIIKTSIVFIRDMDGKVIGFLGINLDITEINRLQQVLEEMIRSDTSYDGQHFDETYATHIDEVFDNITKSTIVELGIDVENLKRKDRITFVRRLESKGIFLIQGAADRIADLVGVSKQTIYNSLEEK